MVHEKFYPNSHLFTVRLWAEKVGDDQFEWRGKVQHLPGGDVHYFRDWSVLINHLVKMLPQLESLAKASTSSESGEPVP